MSETQTCPRRTGEAGPWEHKDGLDRWETDRWSADAEAVKQKHDAEDAAGLERENLRLARLGRPSIKMEEYRTRVYVRGPSNDLWLWTWGPPRTCSFCGGIHPDDAIRLVLEGWEVDTTGKSYKRYLNPPGTATRQEAFLASIRDGGREPGQGVPSVWSPTPPVKVYVAHFSEEQVRRFNEAIRNR